MKHKLSYMPDEWEIRENTFSEETNRESESVFSLGNGYIGVRGTFEEGFYGDEINSNAGAFINGIYEYNDYKHLWKRPGFPERTHSILNVPNPYPIGLVVDNEIFSMARGTVTDYSRVLKMNDGVVVRRLKWRSPGGKEIVLEIERFTSLDAVHTIAVSYSITPLNFSAPVTLVVTLDGDVRNANLGKPEIGGVTEPVLHILDKGTCNSIGFVSHKTDRSGFMVATAMKCTSDCTEHSFHSIPHPQKITHNYSFNAEKGTTCTFNKYVTYYTSRDAQIADCLNRAMQDVENASRTGYQELRMAHCKQWHTFWDRSDIQIDGSVELQQGVRFSLYHLMQSAGKDGSTNISANGLTGEGYQGHTFWDTEIYMLPFFIYTQPDIARQLLLYRYSILDKARERARQMGDHGALFAWNSINGEECGFVFEAATAQYHLNSDICYAIYRYVEATGDEQFLTDFGAEIVFETAKCIAHRGAFIPFRNNAFCINVVCGPDEYTPAVDNNCYTNTMARFHLRFAYETAKRMEQQNPSKYKELIDNVQLDEEELRLWKKASDTMYIPYNEEYGILMQDDAFLYRDPVILDSFPPEKRPLLTNLHPLNLWRYQVSKQADVVLLMILFGYEYPAELRKAVYDFYEPRTIHDSSLSPSVHSIAASAIGYTTEAFRYFEWAARMDLDNRNGNTALGIHAACLGGVWMAVVHGFAGMQVYRDTLHFAPYLPEQVDHYSFSITFRESRIRVAVTEDEVRYELVDGTPVTIEHCGNPLLVSKDTPVCTSLQKIEKISPAVSMDCKM